MEWGHRRSIRLPGYDYTQEGFYFVTICTYRRGMFLGEMGCETMKINALGKMVYKLWMEIPKHFPVCRMDKFQIMPNHLHGILVIGDGVGAGSPRPLLGRGNRAPTLGQMMAYFKYQTTKEAHRMGYVEEKLWQRNYYEHIIRNEKEYWAVRQYIQDNPKNWEKDELFLG